MNINIAFINNINNSVNKTIINWCIINSNQLFLNDNLYKFINNNLKNNYKSIGHEQYTRNKSNVQYNLFIIYNIYWESKSFNTIKTYQNYLSICWCPGYHDLFLLQQNKTIIGHALSLKSSDWGDSCLIELKKYNNFKLFDFDVLNDNINDLNLLDKYDYIYSDCYSAYNKKNNNLSNVLLNRTLQFYSLNISLNKLKQGGNLMFQIVCDFDSELIVYILYIIHSVFENFVEFKDKNEYQNIPKFYVFCKNYKGLKISCKIFDKYCKNNNLFLHAIINDKNIKFDESFYYKYWTIIDNVYKIINKGIIQSCV